MDPFVVLGISNQSTETEVKRRYKVLALKHHPDKAGKEVTAEFQEINEAHETIIEKELYFDLEKATEEAASQHDGDKPRQEANSRHRPEPAPQRPSTPPPHSPVRSTAQQPPLRAHQPRPSRPRPPNRDDAFRMDFIGIRYILWGFTWARMLCLGPCDYLTDWPEVHRSFRDFDDMLLCYKSFEQLSDQLGDLIFAIKVFWSNDCDAVSSQFVLAFSFVAMISVTGIVKRDFLTARLWRVAEKAFLDLEREFECAYTAYFITSKMILKDTWLQRCMIESCWLSPVFWNGMSYDRHTRNIRPTVYTSSTRSQ